MRIWWKVILGLFVLGIVAAILSYIFIYNKPHPDYEKLEAAYSMEAKSLFNKYRTNKVASDGKYTGQVIQIKGIITKIEDSDSFVVAVFVFEEGMYGDEGVRCNMLPDYEEICRKLDLTKEVSIKGYCVGYNETDIILEKCSITN